MHRFKHILRSDSAACYAMMAAPAICIGIFVVFPFLWTAYFSFFRYDGFGTPAFVGFSNYAAVFFKTPLFWSSFANSCLFALGKLVIELPVSLLLANVLIRRYRGARLFRGLIFLPYVFSTAVIGIVFSYIFSHQSGAANLLLRSLGKQPVQWFSDRYSSLFTVLLASTWQNTGLNMMYFTTGLVNISASVEEAAMLDGASAAQRFFRITLPMMRPTIIIVVINSVLGSLHETDLFLTLSAGSPAGLSESVMSYIYRSFTSSNSSWGMTSAMSMVTSILLLAITLVYFRILRKNRSEGLT